MEYKKTILSQILNSINKFNEAVAINDSNTDYVNFNLGYCITHDTLHSFHNQGRDFNGSGFKEPYIKIDLSSFEDFKKHFGRGFAHKFMDLIDNWREKNNFPYIYNSKINSLPEHKELESLYSKWEKMTEQEKFDEFLDLDSIQKRISTKTKELQDLENLLM